MYGERLFSLPRIIGGISRTLDIANQVIPIYKNAKPVINNARNALSKIKEVANNSANKIMDNTNKNMQEIKEKIDIKKSVNNMSNTPQFFQ